MTMLQAALLFISAGSVRWLAGWWYIGLYILMLAGASFVMLPTRREVVEERSKGTKGGKAWDLYLTRLMIIPSFGLLIVSGLDERWGWTPPLQTWIRLLGVSFFLLGFMLVLWAMYTNKYFSQTVRIQTERGHTAVTSGPYRLVRHPGYLGMIISLLGAVFILDSLWGITCFAFYLAVIITRTAFEDRTLQAELPGYREFTQKTKYRIIPGVW
jgi:protein-S-isoprenylcysteine O-methyltransferase Ste14